MMNPYEITSVENNQVKHIVALHSPKGRAKHQQFIAQGVRVCTTLLTQSASAVQRLYTLFEHYHTLLDIAGSIPIAVVTPQVMRKISTTTTPSGVVAVCAIPPASSLETMRAPGLVLVDISDPGNMGTLIRTAAALRTPTIVTINGVDAWNPKVVQASAGAIGMVTLYQCSWHELVQHAHAHNYPLAGLVVEGGQTPTHQLLAQSLIVIGSEGHGLTQEQQAACSSRITLPMPGGTESLNAAVAGSIALYVARQPLNE